MADSISRTFARWAATLSYEELPAAVIDKLKALLLFHLVAAALGADNAQARHLADLVKVEEPRPDGATLIGDGAKVSRNAACMANCETMDVAGLFDSYRMITHPGPVLTAVALANAELEGRNGRQLLTALAAGYEFECRLADDFVPSVSAHGFRPAPIFSTMGAAMVAGKLLDLDESGFMAAIAVAANCASGLNEPGRSGVGMAGVHEPNSARQGTYAALMASMGDVRGSEQAIEGPAGFYRGFAGSNDGRLSYVFNGPRQIDLGSITEGLGSDYKLLHVMFRMYPTAGYNQPVIDLVGEMHRAHRVQPEDVRELTVYMNYIETLYPSPEFPQHADPSKSRVGSTQYFAAHAAVNGGFPVVGALPLGPDGVPPDKDEAVLAFMAEKVRLVGVHDQPMFSPEVVIALADGRCLFGRYPYARMEWNFDELLPHLRACVPGLSGGEERLTQLIDVVSTAEDVASVAPLLEAVGTW